MLSTLVGLEHKPFSLASKKVPFMTKSCVPKTHSAQQVGRKDSSAPCGLLALTTTPSPPSISQQRRHGLRSLGPHWDLVRSVYLHLQCPPRGRYSGRVGEIMSMCVEDTSNAILKEFVFVHLAGGGKRCWVSVSGWGAQAVGGRAAGEAGSAE